MNKPFNDQWKLLQQVRPTRNQKEALRTRILDSIAHSPTSISYNRFFQWKSIVATCLLFLIFGSFLLLILQESTQRNASEEPSVDYTQFSWKLNDVYSVKSGDSMLLYRKENPVEVGTVKEVTEEGKNELVKSLPMYVEKPLENFPYPMTMYIEHVKMMEVSLRYHFFIAFTDEKWIHITFDYPKLEYAEIFHAMSTLELKAKEPYVHNKQLYAKHGYGDLLYPVGLEPVSISHEKEIYHWPNASSNVYSDYLGKIEDELNWQHQTVDGLTHTFVHGTWETELTITLDGKEITYEFVYHNQDE
ncbi:hypothetical protein ACFSCX_07285 [Bacillus salitolerans]|uniref:DUF4179 domain-containing protein n=1 Tax=Bacillus salitolerans TaxID=1437434 RepID=A0ABW4LMG0_9BACI